MTTYNTGNPIGSTDARDRLDNSENMDILENSTTLNAHPDRLGTMRKTRKGMELEHDNQISAHEAEHDAQIAAHEVEHDNQIAAHEAEHDAQIAAHEAEHDNQMQSFENEFDGRLAGMAFTRVGSFTTGATLTDMRQVLVWEASQGGDGHEYGWAGTFPKVVAAGATPTTSGGIGAGAWVDRTDDTLRDEIRETVFQNMKRSYAEAGLNMVDGSFEAGGTLVNANDVLLQERTGKAFSGPAGIVSPGSSPLTLGFLDASMVLNQGVWTANVASYGARGDGVTNCDSAFSMAINALSSKGGGVLLVPVGTFLVKHIDLIGKAYSNITIIGVHKKLSVLKFDSSGGRVSRPPYPTSTYSRNNSADGLIYVSSNTSNTTNDADAVKNIKIEKLGFLFDVVTAGFDELMHCVCGYGVSGFEVFDCDFVGFLGDGVCISQGDGVLVNAYNGRVLVHHNSFDGVNRDNRQAISIYYCTSYAVRHNYIKNVTRSNMPGAIDVEPDNAVRDSFGGDISDNTIDGCSGAVGAITIICRSELSSHTASIKRNTLRDVVNAFALINTGPKTVDDFRRNFVIKDNTVIGFNAHFIVRGIVGAEIVRNTYTGQTGQNTSIDIENSLSISLRKNNFNGISAADGIVVDNLSGDVEFIGNKFKALTGKACTVQYTESRLIIKDNTFEGSGSGTPIVTHLLSMPQQNGTEFSGNVSLGSYDQFNYDKFLALLGVGTPITDYNVISPLKYPIGTTTYRSAGTFPEVTLGSTDMLVEVTRVSGTDKVMMRLTPLSYNLGFPPPCYVRVSTEEGLWGQFRRFVPTLI